MAISNHKNIQSPQKFNPPTVHADALTDSPCYVYDPAAWSNKNKRGSENTGGPESK